MIIHFERVEWNNKRLGVIVDNTTRLCTSTHPSIGFLKHSDLDHVLKWGLRSAHTIEIVYTTTPQAENEVKDKDLSVLPRVFVEEDAQ